MSISLPQTAVKAIRQRVKDQDTTISSYFLGLFNQDTENISAEELLRQCKKAEREHKQGKSIKAHSIMELLDIDV